jgi:hypothetical protein
MMHCSSGCKYFNVTQGSQQLCEHPAIIQANQSVESVQIPQSVLMGHRCSYGPRNEFNTVERMWILEEQLESLRLHKLCLEDKIVLIEEELKELERIDELNEKTA